MDNSGLNGIIILESEFFVEEKIAAVKFERPVDMSDSGFLTLEFEEYYYIWLTWGVLAD